jgi:CRP-like cAMP-binding protein
MPLYGKGMPDAPSFAMIKCVRQLSGRERVITPHNQVLELARQADPAWLRQHLQEVDLELGEELYSHRDEITHIHFPISCVAAVYRSLPDGRTAEVASIGNEGMVGIGALIDGRSLLGETIVQVSGKAIRVSSDVISLEFVENCDFQRIALHYIRFYISQVMQSVLCYKLHDARGRYARWLLQTQDRVSRRIIPATQDAVSKALSMRRATIGDIAADFQRMGIIQYRRGNMEILQRGELEAASCECYAALGREYGRLMDMSQSRTSQSRNWLC